MSMIRPSQVSESFEMLKLVASRAAALDRNSAELSNDEWSGFAGRMGFLLPSFVVSVEALQPLMKPTTAATNTDEMLAAFDAVAAELSAADRNGNDAFDADEIATLSATAQKILAVPTATMDGTIPSLETEVRLGRERGMLTVSDADLDTAKALVSSIQEAARTAVRSKQVLPANQWPAPSAELGMAMVSPAGTPLIPVQLMTQGPGMVAWVDPLENTVVVGQFGMMRREYPSMPMHMFGPVSISPTTPLPTQTNMTDRGVLGLAMTDMSWAEWRKGDAK
jgi:hypothetical protein